MLFVYFRQIIRHEYWLRCEIIVHVLGYRYIIELMISYEFEKIGPSWENGIDDLDSYSSWRYLPIARIS
jgi:hypothetical protein